MAAPDQRFKTYFNVPERCADLVNMHVYNGKKVIQAKDITFLNSEIINQEQGLQRFEDETFEISRFTDGRHDYAIVDFEGQDEVDYTMVFRLMLTSAMQYLEQCKALRLKEHERKVEKAVESGQEPKEIKFRNRAELQAGEKVHAVVNFVLYLGPGSWNAYRNIYEALDTTDPDILRETWNFGYHVLCPKEMEDSALGLYSTDLGGILKFIKYSNDKKKLNDIVNSDPLFQNLNQDAFSLLQAVTKLPIEPPQ